MSTPTAGIQRFYNLAHEHYEMLYILVTSCNKAGKIVFPDEEKWGDIIKPSCDGHETSEQRRELLRYLENAPEDLRRAEAAAMAEAEQSNNPDGLKKSIKGVWGWLVRYKRHTRDYVQLINYGHGMVFGEGDLERCEETYKHWYDIKGELESELCSLENDLVWMKTQPVGDNTIYPPLNSGQPDETIDGQLANAEQQRKSDSMSRLVSLYTGGIADTKIVQVENIQTNDNLTVNEKLWKMDKIMPIPAKASAKQLGTMLKVSKTAIQKTEWWMQNRKGKKSEEIESRKKSHKERSNTIE
jgi:hypothetical protein